MKNSTILSLMRFPVLVERLDNHEVYRKHLIYARTAQEGNACFTGTCEMQGYRLVEVGEAEEKTISIDLNALWDGGCNG